MVSRQQGLNFLALKIILFNNTYQKELFFFPGTFQALRALRMETNIKYLIFWFQNQRSIEHH